MFAVSLSLPFVCALAARSPNPSGYSRPFYSRSTRALQALRPFFWGEVRRPRIHVTAVDDPSYESRYAVLARSSSPTWVAPSSPTLSETQRRRETSEAIRPWRRPLFKGLELRVKPESLPVLARRREKKNDEHAVHPSRQVRRNSLRNVGIIGPYEPVPP